MLALGLVKVRRALDGEVVSLGCAGGPDHLLGIGIDERRHVLARLFDCLLGLPAVGVRTARGIAEMLREVRNHLLRDARVHRRGRGVIQVDRQLHAATFSEGFSAAGLSPCFSALLKSFRTATGLPCWCATRSPSDTDDRYSCIFSLRVAQRPCVMQRLSSWQFSLPPHCVASIGSSTAVTMSATETSCAGRARL